jgi:hypothetical protein
MMGRKLGMEIGRVFGEWEGGERFGKRMEGGGLFICKFLVSFWERFIYNNSSGISLHESLIIKKNNSPIIHHSIFFLF